MEPPYSALNELAGIGATDDAEVIWEPFAIDRDQYDEVFPHPTERMRASPSYCEWKVESLALARAQVNQVALEKELERVEQEWRAAPVEPIWPGSADFTHRLDSLGREARAPVDRQALERALRALTDRLKLLRAGPASSLRGARMLLRDSEDEPLRVLAREYRSLTSPLLFALELDGYFERRFSVAGIHPADDEGVRELGLRPGDVVRVPAFGEVTVVALESDAVRVRTEDGTEHRFRPQLIRRALDGPAR